jgi:hypothetical protein
LKARPANLPVQAPRLRDLGYVEGRTLIIEPRWVSDRNRVPELAREFTPA